MTDLADRICIIAATFYIVLVFADRGSKAAAVGVVYPLGEEM